MTNRQRKNFSQRQRFFEARQKEAVGFAKKWGFSITYHGSFIDLENANGKRLKIDRYGLITGVEPAEWNRQKEVNKDNHETQNWSVQLSQ